MSLRDQGQRRASFVPARKKKSFFVPLTPDIVVFSGNASFVGVKDNFYGVNPPPLPKGWKFSWRKNTVSRKAQIFVSAPDKKAQVELDTTIFDDKNVPEGCKIFMIYHETGHPIFESAEHKCDEFAFLHSLRAGVTPFLCYVALRAYMPDSYQWRVQNIGNFILSNPQLRHLSDEWQGFSS